VVDYDKCLQVDGSTLTGLEPDQLLLKAPATPDGGIIYIGLEERVPEARMVELDVVIANDGLLKTVTAMRADGGLLQFGRPTNSKKRLSGNWPDVIPAFSEPVEEIVFIDTPELGWAYLDKSGLITPEGYSIVSKAAIVIGAVSARRQTEKKLSSLKI